MKFSVMLAGASMGALLLGSATVSAAPVTLQVCSDTSCWNASSEIAEGVVVNWTNAETTTGAGGTSADTWASNHGFNLDSWSLTMDSDPSTTNNFTLTNSTTSPQTYSVGVSIGVVPAFPNGVMLGSIGFSLTDNSGSSSGATLAAVSGSSIYRATIDGNTARTLWDFPASFTIPGGSTGGGTSFGFPTPEVAPESVDTSIGILINFSLSAGDSVSFTSNFDVQPVVVPVPAAVWLFGSGLLGLFGLSRRKRH